MCNAGHSRPVTSVALIDRGRNFVSCAKDGSALLWDCSSGTQISEPFKTPDQICDCAIAAIELPGAGVEAGRADPDPRETDTAGKLLLLGTASGAVVGVDVRSKGRKLECINADRSAVAAVGFLDEQRAVAGTEAGWIKVWDIRSPANPVVSFKKSDVAVTTIKCEADVGGPDTIVAGYVSKHTSRSTLHYSTTLADH